MGTISIWGPGTSSESSTTGPEVTLSTNSAATAASSNGDRSHLSIHVKNFDVWIRLLPASTDPTARKGSYVLAGETWELPTSWWRKLYTGEVSIINVTDEETPSYYVTELRSLKRYPKKESEKISHNPLRS